MIATCISDPPSDPLVAATSTRRKIWPSSYTNPLYELIHEAHDTFPNPNDVYVSGILSLAAGYSDSSTVASAERKGDKWMEDLLSCLDDSEQMADGMAQQMAGLGIYHRFSGTRQWELPVPIGDNRRRDPEIEPAYYRDPAFLPEMEDCVRSLQSTGVISLSQLSELNS
jgi:hypothetical protein